MKTKVISFFLCFFLVNFKITSQVVFEEGYIVNNNNEKINCLIKNYETVNTPQKFTFKLSDNSKEKYGNIVDYKEFGIGTDMKFVKKEVMIDRSRIICS